MSKHINVSANVDSNISGSKVYAVCFTDQSTVGNEELNKYILESIKTNDGIAKRLSCVDGLEHPGTGSVVFTGKLYQEVANVDDTNGVNVTDPYAIRTVHVLATHGITDTIVRVSTL